MNPCAMDQDSIQNREPASHAYIESALSAETPTGAHFAEAGQAETILLVEDEAFLRNITAEVLESAGYKLIVAGNASEAFELYRCDGPVDLLLADIVMPGLSGRELAAKFEIMSPQIRVLLMTGYPEQLASRERSSLPENYLAKPFTSRVLLRKVREVLDAACRLRAQA